MNPKILSLNQVKYPNLFQSDYIRVVPEYEEELYTLIEKTGQKVKFCKKYQRNLTKLELLREHCVTDSQTFECLLRTNGIYSMRFRMQLNIRILFSFCQDKAILLTCFQEKSTNDYIKFISVAKDRQKKYSLK